MMLIIGAGVAGIACALQAAALGTEVMLVTPGVLGLDSTGAKGGGSVGAADLALAGGNTALAQGGIASALGAGDSPALHAADTVAAGVGLVDADAAWQLCSEGAAAVSSLIDLGFGVDRNARGEVALGLEAAHSMARIVHAGEDQSGAALHAFLRSRLDLVATRGRVRVSEHTSVVSLLSDAGAVTGAVLRDAVGELSAVRADAVVLATGGYAALYPASSNHSGARGEGIVLAARLGAAVADLEFVQFHPTVLAGTGFLISEALRGAGAVLRDDAGARFMLSQHAAAELAPRDVVSRSVHRSMRASGASQVWLDATSIERRGGRGTLARRFPSITRAVRALGIDWAREPVPVAPAAHYTMGGVVTDLDGRTSLPGLFAAGEVACTGVHGANRLASNSLLEGLVFGPRAATAAFEYVSGASKGSWQLRGAGATGLIGRAEALAVEFSSSRLSSSLAREPGASAMTTAEGAAEDALGSVVAAGLGIERDADGLREVARYASAHGGPGDALAAMIATAALERTESRGAHQRADFTNPDPAQERRRAWVMRSQTSGGIPREKNNATHSNTIAGGVAVAERPHAC